MSDEDDMPDFIIGTPEEVQEKVREMMDRQSMAITAMRHDVQRFFTELSVEQLSLLRFLLHQITANPEAGPFYEGVASTTLLLKHNVCPGCGIDHDKEAMETLQAETAKVTSEDRHPSNVSNVISRVDLLEQYRLRPNADGQYNCADCGMGYMSLEDRMLEKPGPEGCDGCIQRAKWG